MLRGSYVIYSFIDILTKIRVKSILCYLLIYRIMNTYGLWLADYNKTVNKMSKIEEYIPSRLNGEKLKEIFNGNTVSSGFFL